MHRLSLQVLKELVNELACSWRMTPPAVKDMGMFRRQLLKELEQLVAAKSRYTTINRNSLGPCLPDLATDIHIVDVTSPSIRLSSGHINQKIEGIGHNLLVLRCQCLKGSTGQVTVAMPWALVYIESCRTADYQTTYGLREILRRKGDRDDILAFVEERFPELTESEREQWATRVLMSPPKLGYLSHSYGELPLVRLNRVLRLATSIQYSHAEGVEELFSIHSEAPA